MRHLPRTEYTSGDQRADTAFLVGVSHGRESERARLATALGYNTERTKDAYLGYVRTGDPALIGLEARG